MKPLKEVQKHLKSLGYRVIISLDVDKGKSVTIQSWGSMTAKWPALFVRVFNTVGMADVHIPLEGVEYDKYFGIKKRKKVARRIKRC